MLSKIVQESVYNLGIDHGHANNCDLQPPMNKECQCTCGYESIEKDFISSQISLLEAELERKKGMIKDGYEEDVFGLTTFNPIKTEQYNQAIQEDIAYLTVQIELIKAIASVKLEELFTTNNE